MNTSAVAKLLNVSHSTIQRWVTQLGMDVERNQQGHYQFSNEDIALLRAVQDQLNEGMILQKITISDKRTKKGKVKNASSLSHQAGTNAGDERITERISRLETGLETKADAVVSYQLLQHRRELEEMQQTVKNLEKRIMELESAETARSDYLRAAEEAAASKKTKKKPLFKNLLTYKKNGQASLKAAESE